MRSKTALLLVALLVACLYFVHGAEETGRKTSTIKKKDRQNPLNSLIPVSLVLMLLALPVLPLMMTGPLAVGLAQPGIQLAGQRLQAFQQQAFQALRPGAGAAAAASNPAASYIYQRQGYRRSSEGDEPATWTTGNKLAAIVSTVEETMDNYEVTNPDCQRFLMCQLHQKTINPKVGTFAEKLIDLFEVESKLEKTSIGNGPKTILKDFLRAARAGLGQRDCSAIYRGCKSPNGPYVKNPNKSG